MRFSRFVRKIQDPHLAFVLIKQLSTRVTNFPAMASGNFSHEQAQPMVVIHCDRIPTADNGVNIVQFGQSFLKRRFKSA